MMERWAAIPGYPSYKISELGEVMRAVGGHGCRAGKILRARCHPYPTVTLTEQGKQYTERVHALVLRAFTGPRPAGMEARHLDGNEKNCRLDNLEWGTSTENTEDCRRHGRLTGGSRGEQQARAKLTEGAVRKIRASTESSATLAVRFGVDVSLVRGVRRGDRWRHVT